MTQKNLVKGAVFGAFLLVLSAMVVACGSDENGDNSDSLRVEFDEPTIQIDPVRYDFSATVGPGDEEEATFVLSNIGAEELEITDLRLNPISADAFETGQNIPRPEITLESLETYSFSVWYRPDDGEDHSGAINLSSNDPERTSATIPLSAEEYSD